MNGDYRLRQPLERESGLLYRWRNSERVRAVMKSDAVITEEEHRAWFGRLGSKTDQRLYLFEKSGEPLGIVQFSEMEPASGTCVWGFYLGEPALPRGTGTMLGYMGLNEAFDRLQLRKVTAEVLASNLASYKLHKKLGFRIEGCLRRHIRRNGGYEDLIIMSVFAEEWHSWQYRAGLSAANAAPGAVASAASAASAEKGRRWALNELRIGDRIVGEGQAPFIIAEMSGNHNQSLERALAIVDAAAEAGAGALKIQTYTADTMTLDIRKDEFVIGDAGSLWKGDSLYALYQKAHTPWAWHEAIFARCRERGMVGFSSPFDAGAVDFLESLGVPCYKIASFEITDIPLIRKAARTGKPLILSTGMASPAEIDDAVAAVKSTGNRQYALLKCTSAYPASPEGSHLRTIPHLRQLFDCPVGLSDHTLGIGASVAAVALGASVIEKHFILSRDEGGVDSAFSLEPAEFALLTAECAKAWQALGRIHYGPTSGEVASLKFRRSLYAAEDMEVGTAFHAGNLRVIRPGCGLAPKYYDAVIGRKVGRFVARGTPVAWDLFE